MMEKNAKKDAQRFASIGESAKEKKTMANIDRIIAMPGLRKLVLLSASSLSRSAYLSYISVSATG